jgi:NADP-dependent 3-hydroxy acid dehydrogenase YdfG
VDVTNAPNVADMVKAITQEFGRVDILVNNAGMNIKQRSIRELTPQSWRLMVGANLDGAFYCIHEVLPQMRQRKDGVIININSVAGKRSGPLGGASYNAAKFGLSALGICVAAEEKDNNIRVCNIFPGEIDTPILENRPVPVTEEQRQKILTAQDVAEAVLFVAALPARVAAAIGCRAKMVFLRSHVNACRQLQSRCRRHYLWNRILTQVDQDRRRTVVHRRAQQ